MYLLVYRSSIYIYALTSREISTCTCLSKENLLSTKKSPRRRRRPSRAKMERRRKFQALLHDLNFWIPKLCLTRKAQPRFLLNQRRRNEQKILLDSQLDVCMSNK
ncbi:hypothetical protein TWF751_002734 [Orbilia oligospora]|nr:hypothetical protein TWF751_002734 [Orbilia oligospora]